MRTADLSATKLGAYSSAESRVDHLANSCVPPVTDPFPAEDSFLEEQTFGAIRDEHLFHPAPLMDLLQLLTSFAAQRKHCRRGDINCRCACVRLLASRIRSSGSGGPADP